MKKRGRVEESNESNPGNGGGEKPNQIGSNKSTIINH